MRTGLGSGDSESGPALEVVISGELSTADPALRQACPRFGVHIAATPEGVSWTAESKECASAAGYACSRWRARAARRLTRLPQSEVLCQTRDWFFELS
ncbi:MAG: hypothetical protein JWL68_5769 [Actinomycetia bacterium]|nr:hypothetical protein [Actinomycetes bacterium]